MPVITLPPGVTVDSPSMRNGLGRGFAAVATALPAGTTLRMTGIDQLSAHDDSGSAGAEVVNLTLIGGLGALAVLVFVFGSLLALAPLLVAVIAAITFVLLARAFRSLLLAAKAVVVDLLSIGAMFGAIVLVWQLGHGVRALGGVAGTGALDTFVPLFVFAFLYGLSMDYEVFLLARMREAYDATGSTVDAVVEGVGRTGRLVTSAALILFLAFASLAGARETVTKIFATGLGAGILLDATLVRCVLVPALVSLMGRWNWWLPAWAARPLGVAPAAAPRPVVAAPADSPRS